MPYVGGDPKKDGVEWLPCHEDNNLIHSAILRETLYACHQTLLSPNGLPSCATMRKCRKSSNRRMNCRITCCWAFPVPLR